MNYQLLFLIAALIIGAIPGYFLRNNRNLWSIADLLWTGAAIVTMYFTMVGLEQLSRAADRTFYVDHLAAEQDRIRVVAYGLEQQYCPSQPSTVISPSNGPQSICPTLHKILFFSSLTKFSELDAQRLVKEIEQFQGTLRNQGVTSLVSGLNEYARFRTLRKKDLEINPYQDLVEASDRFGIWFLVLIFLLAFRSGRTFAEMGRFKDEKRRPKSQKVAPETEKQSADSLID